MDIKAINQQVITQFRAGGPVDGMQRDKLLLLTTVGRKSGQAHTSPMMFVQDDSRLLVIASNMGSPSHPAWYLNLVDHPSVEVELTEEAYQATASTLDGADHDQTWARIKEQYPFFADHEKQAGRTIPIVELRRSEPSK